MYEMNGRVRYSEIDMKGNLTIAALINYLQDSSTFDSEDAGVGFSFLHTKGWGWYITNWQIELNALPALGDRITVKTWVHHLKGMFAYRNYELRDAAGEALVRANSIWLLMDIEKVVPVRIPEEVFSVYTPEPAIDREWGNRKILLASGHEEKGVVTVMPLHLDTNHHMNNEHYIEIARDVLPKGEKIFEIETEYKKAAVLGDVLYIRRAKKDERTWQVLLTGRDERTVFAIVDFITEKGEC